MRKRSIIAFLFFITIAFGCRDAQNGPGDEKGKQNTVSEETSSLAEKAHVPVTFWDNRRIFFKDFTGESSTEVYAAIKGQKYFDNSFIFVYASLEDMEGTDDYTKIEDTFKSTKLDDRIFIWVHLNAEKEVLFVKKLISDNIRDVIEQAPNQL